MTAITGAYFTLDISRRMNGVVCAGKDTRASKRGWDTRTSSTRCVIQSSHTVGVRAGLLAASSRSIKLRWGVTRTLAFLIGCIALISGALPTCAAGLGWKVLRPQAVKDPEVCFYGSANVVRANGLLSVWTKCLAKEDLNQCRERGFYWFALGHRR